MSASHPHHDLGTAFGETFPLPLRILSLIALGLLAFASNLHVLSWGGGIDVATVLDIKSADGMTYTHPSRLHPPIYQLAFYYAAWTALGCATYTYFADDTHGAVERYMPAAFVIIGVLAVFMPFDKMRKRERYMFLRCVSPSS